MTLCLETIKITNLIWLASLYTFIGIIFNLFYSDLYSNIIPQSNEIVNIFKNNKDLNILIKKDKNIINKLFLYTLIEASILFLGAYILKKFINYIPFPFEGYCGFTKTLIKKRNGSILIALVSMIFFTFRDKIIIYKNIYDYDKLLLIKPFLFIIILILIINYFTQHF